MHFSKTTVNERPAAHSTVCRCPLHGCIVCLSLETPASTKSPSGSHSSQIHGITDSWHLQAKASCHIPFHPLHPQKKEISVSVAWDLMYHRLSRRMWQAEMVRDHSTGYTRAGLHTDAVFIYTSFWEAHEIKKWVICNCSQRYWATWTTKQMRALIVPHHTDLSLLSLSTGWRLVLCIGLAL